MKFIHGMEICQNPWGKCKNIIDLKILLGCIPFSYGQVRFTIHYYRVDDLVIAAAITLYLAGRDSQRSHGKIAITYVHQPFTPIQLHQQRHMFEFPAKLIIAMLQPSPDHLYVKSAKGQQTVEQNI